HFRPYRHCVGVGVYLNVDEVADARMRITTSVWQLDVNLHVRILVLRFGNPALVFQHIALTYLKYDVDGILLDDCCEFPGGGLHQVSFGESGESDSSIDR